jgi:hypothetical protein
MTEIRKSSRAGRGALMASLIATEELEKPTEDTFWSGEGKGGLLWGNAEKDSNLDDDEFGEDKNENDSEDSDINIREDPTLETAVLGEVPEEKKRKKKSVYVDPKRRKSKIEIEEEEEKSRRSTKKKKLNNGEPQIQKKVTPVNRNLRRSTVSSSQQRKAQRENEKGDEGGLQKKDTQIVVKLTQMQLLEEAKSTELFNVATLERMKKLEAIKKKPVPIRKKITGPKVIELHRREGNYVIFEGSELPSLFTIHHDVLK